MPLTIEDSIVVAAPPEAVWKLLSDPSTWRAWWPGCLDAGTADRKRLREGSQLLLEIKPSWLRWRLRAKVEAFTPGKVLIWAGTMTGLGVRHGWYLEPRPNGTAVRQQQVLTGPALPLVRLLRQIAPARRMARTSLTGLRQLAERAL